MGGDKDIEDQIPDMGDDDFMQDDLGDLPADDIQDVYADEPIAGEEDFIEEDWESYDDENYLDDSDTISDEEALKRRRAVFNRSLMAGGAAIFLIVVFYMFFSGEKDIVDAVPVAEQVSEALPVAETQKVEFHAETKLEGSDSYGVKYGEHQKALPTLDEDKGPQHGMLHDPKALAKIKNRQALEEKPYDGDSEFTDGSEDASQNPPMPSPISQASSDDLIPMPEPLGEGQDPLKSERLSSIEDPFSSDSANIPDADSMIKSTDDAQSVPRSPFDGDADMDPARQLAGGGAQVDNRLIERLDGIENQLAKMDDLQQSMERLEKRIDTLEKSGTAVKVKKASAPQATSYRPPVKKVATPQAVQNDWVLKSAQPDKAMLSRRGQSEIYTVSVGETLRGIGAVTGIFVENGRWVVQGTNGRVVQ